MSKISGDLMAMQNDRTEYHKTHNKKKPVVTFRVDDPIVADILANCENKSKLIKEAIKFHAEKVSNTPLEVSNTHQQESVLLTYLEFLMDFFEDIKLTKTQQKRITKEQRETFTKILEVLPDA